MGKWLVGGPPLLYLLVFFAAPALIMVLASFRTPGEFGGLAPLRDADGNLDLTLESYTRFLTEPLYWQIFLFLLNSRIKILKIKHPRKHREKVWKPEILILKNPYACIQPGI